VLVPAAALARASLGLVVWSWKRIKDETLSFRGVLASFQATCVDDEAGSPTGAAFAPVGVQARNLLLVLVVPARFANPGTSRQTG
jgi:hypothetical protein